MDVAHIARDGDASLRCDWAGSSPLMAAYHDLRWCVPEHDDRELFAMLCLEGMQAGLSWSLIIEREKAMRAAFDGFDPQLVASYDEDRVEQLMRADGVVHNRLKIRSIIGNARAFLAVQEEWESFDRYIWSFTEGAIAMNHPQASSQIPTQSALSEKVSADLRKRGFKFVGPVITYSYLQAIGVINDHVESCPWKYR